MKKIIKFMEKISNPFMYHQGLISYENYLVVADEKQLAVCWHNGQIPDGCFKVEKDQLVKTNDINSANVPANAETNLDIIISMAKDYERYTGYTSSTFSFKDGKDNIFVNSICRLIINSGVAFNFELIKPLGKISHVWEVDYKDRLDILRFTNGNFVYCLMPIEL